MCSVTRSCQTLYPTSVLCPCNFPGKNPGVGCHFLLQTYGQLMSNSGRACLAIFPRDWAVLHSLHALHCVALSAPLWVPQWDAVASLCVVLHSSDLEHSSTCFFDISTPSFEKSLFRCFAHFLVTVSSSEAWLVY